MMRSILCCARHRERQAESKGKGSYQMMKVAIATDTNSGMTQEKAQELGVYLLPMPVIIEDEMYLEGVDITSAQLYEAMHQHHSISSSQPSPAD